MVDKIRSRLNPGSYSKTSFDFIDDYLEFYLVEDFGLMFNMNLFSCKSVMFLINTKCEYY
jgi:hypothetical protein